jgi:hypothetical protein
MQTHLNGIACKGDVKTTEIEHDRRARRVKVMKTNAAYPNAAHPNAQPDQALVTDLFVESSLSIFGFIALVLLLV